MSPCAPCALCESPHPQRPAPKKCRCSPSARVLKIIPARKRIGRIGRIGRMGRMGVFSHRAQRYPSSVSAPIAPIKLSASPLSAGIKNNTRAERRKNMTNRTNGSFFPSSAALPIKRQRSHHPQQAPALPSPPTSASAPTHSAPTHSAPPTAPRPQCPPSQRGY